MHFTLELALNDGGSGNGLFERRHGVPRDSRRRNGLCSLAIMRELGGVRVIVATFRAVHAEHLDIVFFGAMAAHHGADPALPAEHLATDAGLQVAIVEDDHVRRSKICCGNHFDHVCRSWVRVGRVALIPLSGLVASTVAHVKHASHFVIDSRGVR